MPDQESPYNGHCYRFNLGTKKSAADFMFDVHVLGDIDKAAAVAKAKEIADEQFCNGIDIPGVAYGRLYVHTSYIDEDSIIDIYNIQM